MQRKLKFQNPVESKDDDLERNTDSDINKLQLVNWFLSNNEARHIQNLCLSKKKKSFLKRVLEL